MGGCGLVVTEMVSSEGLVRGIDRTLEYAEYTEEERPVSIQIFGGDPQVMADAAQIVEGMGADIVDINMGCPVPKIAKHNAGCSLMREPGARRERRARDGEGRADSGDREDARRLERARDQRARAGADGRGRRRRRGGRARPNGGAVLHRRIGLEAHRRGRIGRVRFRCSGRRLRRSASGGVAASGTAGVSGVLVGRGALRNPWIFQAVGATRSPAESATPVSLEDRGQFLLEYIDLLLKERVDEADGFRHAAPGRDRSRVDAPAARGRARAASAG